MKTRLSVVDAAGLFHDDWASHSFFATSKNLGNTKVNTATAVLSNGQTVSYCPDVIGEGSDRRICFTADKKYVIAFFKTDDPLRLETRLRCLRTLVEKLNPVANQQQGDFWADLLSCPQGIVVQPAPGVLYPVHPAHFYFREGPFHGKEKELRWYTSRKLRSLVPVAERGTWLNSLQVSIMLARLVRRLHQLGLALASLSPSDCLTDWPSGKVRYISTDAICVQGEPPPEFEGWPAYLAPEILVTQHLPPDDPGRSLPSPATDVFALAILIYQLLLQRHPLLGPKVHDPSAEVDVRLSLSERALFIEHPSDSSNRPADLKVTCETLGPTLKNLMERAFIKGLHQPVQRPSAAEWEQALCQTLDLLIPCNHLECQGKWCVLWRRFQGVCTWCGNPLEQSLPILRLSGGGSEPPAAGSHELVVGWQQQHLYPWHLDPKRRRDESADCTPLACVINQKSQWVLVNEGLDDMVSPGGKVVPRGAGVALEERKPFWLSRASRRAVSVRLLSHHGSGWERRLPLYWLLDCSASMRGEPIEALRQGLQSFLGDMRGDPQALETCWLSAITFGTSATVAMPLTSIFELTLPSFTADPPTPQGDPTALGQALDLLLERLELEWEPTTAAGVGDWKPNVVVVLDGPPTDGWESAANKLRQKASQIVVLAASPWVESAPLKALTDTVLNLAELRPDSLASLYKYMWFS